MVSVLSIFQLFVRMSLKRSLYTRRQSPAALFHQIPWQIRISSPRTPNGGGCRRLVINQCEDDVSLTLVSTASLKAWNAHLRAILRATCSRNWIRRLRLPYLRLRQSSSIDHLEQTPAGDALALVAVIRLLRRSSPSPRFLSRGRACPAFQHLEARRISKQLSRTRSSSMASASSSSLAQLSDIEEVSPVRHIPFSRS